MCRVSLFLFLSFALVPSSYAPSDKGADAESAFQTFATDVFGCGFMQHEHYSIVPGIEAWALVKEYPELKGFPQQLLRFLRDPREKDHQFALEFVQNYVALARTNARGRGLKDLESAARRTFGTYTEPIRTSLRKTLESSDVTAQSRCIAAACLLAFEAQHAKANAILAEGMEANDAKLRQQICESIGALQLAHGSAVKVLIRGLQGRETSVRQSAAIASWRIGRQAKAAVPELVKLFEAGKVARCEVETLFSIGVGWEANVALLALSEMGPDALPAASAILNACKSRKTELSELLSCLASIGPAAKEAIPTLRQVLTSKNQKLRLVAACATLKIAPANSTALDEVKKGLSSDDETVREHALEACESVRPNSKELVPSLIFLLSEENEHRRILAIRALARMGQNAAVAIPKFEKLAIRKSEGLEFTFWTHQTVAQALASLGKGALPALIRATAHESGGRYQAILSLGTLGQDGRPAVEHLISLVKDKEDPVGRFAAVVALGMLGEHAGPAARRVLEAITDDEDEMVLRVHWALMEIPKTP